MAVLSAIFKGVDEISAVLESIADRGTEVSDQLEGIGGTASEAFGTVSGTASTAAQSLEDAAASTDYWTEAVGNYNKGAMEAIYSTEELVEMGYKTEAALEAEAATAQLCATAADQLSQATDAASRIQDDLTQSLEKGADVAERVADNDKVSAETKDELAAAMEKAEQAASALSAAEEQAALAAEHLTSVTADASASQEELEAAAEQAANAAEQLATANGNAATATENLADAAGQAAAEEEKMGDSGSESIQQIQQAITAAGLAVLLKEIGEAALEMANAFSEAESTIVKATGATGDALDSLSESMTSIYASAPEEMANVASAVGEINTRLGLQGEELESVTSLFVDYARITDSDVTESVQNVTKVMKNWNVEVSETEALLDKFSYAAQASSASVDELSDLVYSNKAYLDQLGYSLDESIALFAMFEYEGLNATTMMTGFRTAINGFTDEGLDASEAMQDVIEQIASMGDASEATALAVDTFGARAGAQLADAIRTGRFEIDDWVAAIASADGTLATTAEAAMTLEDRWSQATNSMSAAFSTVLSPAIEGISGAFAGLVQGVGDFLGRHPALVAALSGAAVGIAAVVAAFTVYTAVTAAASAVTAAFGTTAAAALLPLTAIVAAIGAVVAVGALLISKLTSANEEYNALTATSKNYYDQLEQLNAEYDEAVELYGENSAAARQLAADIAGMEALYESTAMTLEEFVAQNDALLESHDALIESFSSSMSALDKEANTADVLVTKLEQLSAKSSLTAGEQMQMEAIVKKLNDQFPDLALSIDETTGALNKNVDVVRELATAQAEQQRTAQQYETYVDLLVDQLDLEEQLTRATEERIAAEERRDEVGGLGIVGQSRQARKDLEALTEEEERLQAALDETNGLLAEHEDAFEAAAAASEEAANAVVDYETGVDRALSSVQSDLDELVEAYDAAYEAARSSIDSTIGLFDTMATECELSTNDMLASWQSQVDYLELYAENLRKAAEYGIDNGLIASLSDGSEESAGYIDAIVAEYERLESIGEDAEQFVGEFNEAFQEVEEAKDEWATTVAEIETDFADSMDAIQAQMEEAIDDMNMEAEAAAAAKDTIQAYIDQIKSMTGEARSAAEGVAQATASALSGSGGGGTRGYAVGTLSAEPGLALVGEEGPELINFKGGEVVYTADETRRIVTGMGDDDMYVQPPAGLDLQARDRDAGPQKSEKKITLEIAGKGSIEIDGSGYNEEKVIAWLFDNLKPTLISLLRNDILEEGDLSYEF